MTKVNEIINKRGLFWLMLGVTFFVFIYLIRSILLPFVLGIAIAYLLDPAVRRLQKNGASRGMAALLMIVCFFMALIALALIVVPIVSEEFSSLFKALPDYAENVQEQYTPIMQEWLRDLPADYVRSIKAAMADTSGMMVKLAGEFIGGVFHSGIALLNILSLILITPVVAFYLLRDWNTVVKRFNGLLPRPHADTIRTQIHLIEKTLDGFVRGQLTVCVMLGSYYAIALSLVGLKFAIIIGLMTGMLVIFPYVGLLLGTLTGLGVAFFQFDNYGDIGAVLAVFITGQIAEAYFLTPKLVGEKVGLHPVWIIFGMLAGGALFGFVGVLLAVPATAVIGVLIRFAIDHYIHSSYYEGEAPSNPAHKKS